MPDPGARCYLVAVLFSLLLASYDGSPAGAWCFLRRAPSYCYSSSSCLIWSPALPRPLILFIRL